MLPIPVSFAFSLQFLVICGQIAESALRSAQESRVLVADGLALALFLAGAIWQRLTFDRERARTFEGAHQVIEDRIQLEMEREQQEQLLLSVIPAYIAAEVRRRIMLRMTDDLRTTRDDGRRREATLGTTPSAQPRMQFHELYVQRHNNVRSVKRAITDSIRFEFEFRFQFIASFVARFAVH